MDRTDSFRVMAGDRLARMERAKVRTDAMVDYLRNPFQWGNNVAAQEWAKTKAGALSRCGAYVIFRRYLDDVEGDDLKLRCRCFCHQYKGCGICAACDMYKLAEGYREKVEQVKAHGGAPFGVSHFVFTIRNGESLSESFEFLRASFQKLQARRRDYMKKGWGLTEFRKLEGGAGTYEVGRGKNSGLWHPHIHLIGMQSKFIDQNNLSAEWKEITQGRGQFVYIKAMTRVRYLEVFKYILKFGGIPIEDNVTAWRYLEGRQLRFCFGNLRGVEVDENYLDLLRPGALPYFDYALRWMEGYRYQLVAESSGVQGVADTVKKDFQVPLGVRKFHVDGYSWHPVESLRN